MNGSRILLIIGGGIAAYKCLELIRALRARGASVRIVMTKAAAHFVTPLSLGALSNDKVYSDLFDLNDEREIGHIRLSRETDLIVVAPATANLLAKMAGGHGDDLASCVLLATDKPVLVAPAMNPKMWAHRATARNVELLKGDGIAFVGPDHGEMAESGEAGEGRLVDLPSLLTAIDQQLQRQRAREPVANSDFGDLLRGKHIVITAGPTHEPIDPVRYIANRSSGKQGYAIARAAAQAGANVTLIAGPTNLPDPAGIAIHHVETARDMLQSVRAALPADIAIFTAAVADWRVAGQAGEKIKKDKSSGASVPSLRLIENPDILRTIATAKKQRPQLVIGFAAETQSDRLIEFAQAKLARKGCDWIVANDVSVDATGPGDTATSGVTGGVMGGVMGGDENTVHIVTRGGVEDWPRLSKQDVAQRLIARISAHVSSPPAPKRKVSAS